MAARLGLNRRVPISLRKEDDIFVVSFDDQQVALPTAQRWHRYKRGWKPRGDRFLHQFGISEIAELTKGDTVIDIGANVGEFSISAAMMGANVHAVEGDPLVFRYLSRNCAANDQITPHQHVLWSEDTEVTFFGEPTDANCSVIEPTEGGEVIPITVNAVRLDTLAKNAGIEDVHLIKCDAEGAEPEVIKGRQRFCAVLNSAPLIPVANVWAKKLPINAKSFCQPLVFACFTIDGPTERSLLESGTDARAPYPMA